MKLLESMRRIPEETRSLMGERGAEQEINDFKEGVYYGVVKNVEVVNQLQNPDVNMIVEKYGEIRDEEAAKRFGARNLAEYSYWSWRSCGIANVATIMRAENVSKGESLFDLVQEGLQRRGYAYRNKWGRTDVGWKHEVLVGMLEERGLESRRRSGVGSKELIATVGRGDYAIASVKSETGGHMILIKGVVKIDGNCMLLIDDPYAIAPDSGRNTWVDEGYLEQNYLGTIIEVKQKGSGVNDVDINLKGQLEEQVRIRSLTSIEREWWKDDLKYLEKGVMEQDIGKGELKVLDDQGEGWKLIYSISSKNKEKNYRWVRPETKRFIDSVFEEWVMQGGGKRGKIKLAVTSLGRTLEDQRLLGEGVGWYRTAGLRESSHLAGVAFDVSGRSYYEDIDGEIKSVALWNDEASRFDSNEVLGFLDVLRKREADGECNLCIEKTQDEKGEFMQSVVHVCISPKLSTTT